MLSPEATWVQNATERHFANRIGNRDLHTWKKAVKELHDKHKPFAPENGAPLKFKIGDKVIYTNEYGASFDLEITGLCETTHDLYCTGHRYYLNWDCPWMPVRESSLVIRKDTNLIIRKARINVYT